MTTTYLSPLPSLPRHWRRLCCGLLLIAAGTACSEVPTAGSAALPPAASSPVSAAPKPATTASPLRDQLNAAIGNAACDNAQQCRTLPIGHKACGGPESYKAYSTKAGDSARLGQLAAEYAEERKRSNIKTGMMSTCTVVSDPGATCSAGQCVLLKAGAQAY